MRTKSKQNRRLNSSKAKKAAHNTIASKSKKTTEPDILVIDSLIAAFNAGNYTEAETIADKMTVTFPTYGFGWKGLGVTRKLQGRTQDAILPMQTAAKLAPADIEAHCNLGNALKELGRFSEAEASYRRVLEIKPDYAEALFNLGNTLKGLGRLHDVAISFRRVLAIKPDYAEAHSNLGNALKELGKLGEAETSYRHALKIKPDYDEAYNNLGNLLKQLSRVDEAAVCYRRALQIKPKYHEAYNNLGNLHKDLGKLDEAEADFRRALMIKPDFVVAIHNLGDTLNDMGGLAEAAACYRQALELQPDYSDAYIKLGNVLLGLGRLNLAETCYQRALALNPNLVEAHYNLGVTLQNLTRLSEVEACYWRTLELKPDYAEAYNNLSSAYKELGRLTEAEAGYLRALQIKPDYAGAHSNLGLVLQDLDRLGEAEASYRRALEINQDIAETHNNLGLTLQDLGNLAEAETSYRRALAIKPDYAQAYSNLGNALTRLVRFNEAEACYRRALKINPDFVEAHSNLLFAINSINEYSTAALTQQARLYGHHIQAKAQQFSSWHCSAADQRLCIGFVSGDLSNHPVGYFLENVLAQIDSRQFKLIAYPTQAKQDELTERIKPYFSLWKPLSGLNDATAAQLIHDDGAHILIDLSGHTAYNRLPVFSWKPAPVQVSWLGYFATTGVTEIDYILVDSLSVPDADQIYFSETVWHLPDFRLCFTAPRENPRLLPTPPPALRNGAITFGSFQRLTKINDAVLAAWGRIFQLLPQARLRLQNKQLKDAFVREKLQQRLAKSGISPNRVTFAGTMPREEYLAAHAKVDIILDTFPFPGGTTTCEALWMGAPTLTLAGNSMIARQGAGLLTCVGLEDWIARDVEDYVEKAVRYAGDLDRLSKLRAGLRAQVLTSPLFDAKRFARNFEEALRGMWRSRQPV